MCVCGVPRVCNVARVRNATGRAVDRTRPDANANRVARGRVPWCPIPIDWMIRFAIVVVFGLIVVVFSTALIKEKTDVKFLHTHQRKYMPCRMFEPSN